MNTLTHAGTPTHAGITTRPGSHEYPGRSPLRERGSRPGRASSAAGIASVSPGVEPREPGRRSDRMVRLAMADPDRFVLQIDYADHRGNRTRRAVSPIRFVGGDRFLGLCLCREEPRQFYLSRCEAFRLVSASSVQMPVPIEPLS